MEEKNYTDSFFESTSIRKNVQNDYSEFEMLFQDMVSKKPFINQEIVHTNGNSENKLSTMSDYIKEFLRKIEVEKKSVTCAINGRDTNLISFW